MKTKYILVLAVIAGAFALSCDLEAGDDDDGKKDQQQAGDVDWTSYNTAGTYAIRIKNESNRDLVAFMSSLSQDKLLGGVPKNSNDHGIKLNSTLFNGNKDFSIIFLTKEDYETYKSNLAAREQYPFTRIFAMYNASGTNEVPFIVSSKLGGNNKLTINNLTSLNMELRQDSPRGITLGYAPYEASNTTLYMNDGSFMVFPVFKKYNAVRDEILTIYPRENDGLPVGDQFSFINSNHLTINAQAYMGTYTMSSGAAFLTIKNSTGRGFEVYSGATIQSTESGITVINDGDEFSFTILMDSLSDGKYEESKTLSGWKIVNLGTREKSIPTTTLLSDYRYTVIVEGNWGDGAAGITLTGPTQGSGKITAEFE
jgi:hypothetical protein